MDQHLLHIQNLVTPEICYNTRRFRRLVSPFGASGSGFGIFQIPPSRNTGRENDGGIGNADWMFRVYVGYETYRLRALPENVSSTKFAVMDFAVNSMVSSDVETMSKIWCL